MHNKRVKEFLLSLVFIVPSLLYLQIITVGYRIRETNVVVPDVEIVTSNEVIIRKPKNVIFHVLYDNPSFPLKQCFDGHNVDYIVASYNITNGNVSVDAKNLSYAESRNELLRVTMEQEQLYDYYCFIDGDVLMECNQTNSYIEKLIQSRVTISHPWYENWGIKKCECDYCGIRYSDTSFLCFRSDVLSAYFPLNTYCDKYAWTVHLLFTQHDIIKNDEYYYMDPLVTYSNYRHEKKYKWFNLDCVREYYTLNNITFTDGYIVDPYTLRLKQDIYCKNITIMT